MAGPIGQAMRGGLLGWRPMPCRTGSTAHEKAGPSGGRPGSHGDAIRVVGSAGVAARLGTAGRSSAAGGLRTAAGAALRAALAGTAAHPTPTPRLGAAGRLGSAAGRLGRAGGFGGTAGRLSGAGGSAVAAGIATTTPAGGLGRISGHEADDDEHDEHGNDRGETLHGKPPWEKTKPNRIPFRR